MAQNDDAGFSLVEVIIAMFILAVLALAVLPLAVTASRVSVNNRDLAIATAFANAQLAPVRDAFPVNALTATSCASLRSHAVVDVPGPDSLTADIEVGACPSVFPAAVPVTVTVSDDAGGVVTLPTRILVTAP